MLQSVSSAPTPHFILFCLVLWPKISCVTINTSHNTKMYASLQNIEVLSKHYYHYIFQLINTYTVKLQHINSTHLKQKQDYHWMWSYYHQYYPLLMYSVNNKFSAWQYTTKLWARLIHKFSAWQYTTKLRAWLINANMGKHTTQHRPSQCLTKSELTDRSLAFTFTA